MKLLWSENEFTINDSSAFLSDKTSSTCLAGYFFELLMLDLDKSLTYKSSYIFNWSFFIFFLNVTGLKTEFGLLISDFV